MTLESASGEDAILSHGDAREVLASLPGQSVHFSSRNLNWETPQDFFDVLNRRFHFTLDACATAKTAKCRQFLSPEDDALNQPWRGKVFLNPPYGREIGKWVHKARLEAEQPYCSFVACLLPARTDTAWWHDEIMRYANFVQLLRGRLRFQGAKASAPFPSCLVCFSGWTWRSDGIYMKSWDWRLEVL